MTNAKDDLEGAVSNIHIYRNLSNHHRFLFAFPKEVLLYLGVFQRKDSESDLFAFLQSELVLLFGACFGEIENAVSSLFHDVRNLQVSPCSHPCRYITERKRDY